MQTAATIALFFVLGWGAGAMHFTLLRRNIEALVAGSSALAAVAAMLGRLALTAAIFTPVALLYGSAAVWMLAGFVGARFALVGQGV